MILKKKYQNHVWHIMLNNYDSLVIGHNGKDKRVHLLNIALILDQSNRLPVTFQLLGKQEFHLPSTGQLCALH